MVYKEVEYWLSSGIGVKIDGDFYTELWSKSNSDINQLLYNGVYSDIRWELCNAINTDL